MTRDYAYNKLKEGDLVIINHGTDKGKIVEVSNINYLNDLPYKAKRRYVDGVETTGEDISPIMITVMMYDGVYLESSRAFYKVSRLVNFSEIEMYEKREYRRDL